MPLTMIEVRERQDNPKVRLTNLEMRRFEFNLTVSSGVGVRVSSEFFAGQEKPRQKLTELVTNSAPGTVIIVSGHLGSGKSSLISVVRDDMSQEGNRERDFPRISIYNFMGKLKQLQDDGINKPKAIFIEEFDRKMTVEVLEKSLKTVADIARKQQSVIILSGDYSLRNPALLVDVASLSGDLIYIDLDPLNPDVFKKAIELKISHGLNKGVGEIDMDMFGNELMVYLIPNTNPPIATMRTSLVILSEMLNNLPSNNSPVKLSGDLHKRRNIDFNAKTWHFVSWLHKYVKNHDPNVPMQALKTEDFIKLYPSDEISREEFPSVLQVLASLGVLESVGIPYVDGENQVPEPYLPSQKTFLDAIFDPLPQDTPQNKKRKSELLLKKNSLRG